MTEKTLTTENIKPALDALRGELAPWPVVAKKQDRLNTAQLNAANSGITSSLVAQIIANTAAIRALESAITGTGLRALVVSSLPAIGTQGILYIVPVTTYDPDTDADVVNYSNEYIWIPVEGGTASEGHYEQVGQTGIVINNGQLTITVNGTSVGTFTANQSGNTTAAITVPTNADYVDLSTNQTVAGVKTFSSTINGTASKAIADEDGTSIKTGYVNVAGNQTVSGNKEFTGSNTFNNILPNTTNSYSLGSSSYQWKSVYAQTYYYNGTAWGLDKVNEWSNTNRFLTGVILKNTSIEKGVIPSSNSSKLIYFTDKNNNDLSTITARTNSTGESYIALRAENLYKNGAMDSTGSLAYSSLYVGLTPDGKSYCVPRADVYPEYTNYYNLGTSTNKWKTLNGINPGALSLPKVDGWSSGTEINAAVGIDTTNWDMTSGTWNEMTNNIQDGWVYFAFQNCVASDRALVRYYGTDARYLTMGFNAYGSTGSGYYLYIAFPMAKGSKVHIAFVASGTVMSKFIYPCLGNV